MPTPRTESDDLDRLRKEYANRERRLAGSEIYSLFNQGYLFEIQLRQRETLGLLKRVGINNLESLRILEMGCGDGRVLFEYLGYGAEPGMVYGVDLLPERLREAHQQLPNLSFACADGQSLPYPNEIFDLALQYTAFSSVLDERVKVQLAREMLRVTRTGGKIVWYDFWLNPINRQTRGIRLGEVQQLFPKCKYTFRKVTLAPPLARRIVPISWGLGLFLDSLNIFNTHYLIIIESLLAQT